MPQGKHAARPVQLHGNEVDSPVVVRQIVFLEVGLGGGDEAFRLGGSDGFLRRAEGVGATRFDFHEEDGVAMPGYDVDLAPLAPIVGG